MVDEYDVWVKINKNETFQDLEDFLELMHRITVSIERLTGLCVIDDLKYRINLIEVFTRMKKDEMRLHFFHPIRELSEENKIGIIIYWLLKLKPFYCNTSNLTQLSKPIRNYIRLFNEICAFQALLHFIKTEIDPLFIPTSEMYDKLLYEFRYRNISQSYITNIIISILGRYAK